MRFHCQVCILDAPGFLIKKHKSRNNSTIREVQNSCDESIFTCVFICEGGGSNPHKKEGTSDNVATAAVPIIKGELTAVPNKDNNIRHTQYSNNNFTYNYIKLEDHAKIKIIHRQIGRRIFATDLSLVQYLINIAIYMRVEPKKFARIKYMYIPLPVSLDVYFLNFILMSIIIISDLYYWDADYNIWNEYCFFKYLLEKSKHKYIKNQLELLLLVLLNTNRRNITSELIKQLDAKHSQTLHAHTKHIKKWNMKFTLHEDLEAFRLDILNLSIDHKYNTHINPPQAQFSEIVNKNNNNNNTIQYTADPQKHNTVEHLLLCPGTFEHPCIQGYICVVCVLPNVGKYINTLCKKLPYLSKYITNVENTNSVKNGGRVYTVDFIKRCVSTLGENFLLYSDCWFVTHYKSGNSSSPSSSSSSSSFLQQPLIPSDILTDFVQLHCLYETSITNILCTLKYFKSQHVTHPSYHRFLNTLYYHLAGLFVRFKKNLRCNSYFMSSFRKFNRIRCTVIKSQYDEQTRKTRNSHINQQTRNLHRSQQNKFIRVYNKKTLKNPNITTNTHHIRKPKIVVVDTQITTSPISIFDDYTNIWTTLIAPNIYETVVPNIFSTTTTIHDNIVGDTSDLYENPQNCANPYCKNFMRTSFMMCDHSGLFF